MVRKYEEGTGNLVSQPAIPAAFQDQKRVGTVVMGGVPGPRVMRVAALADAINWQAGILYGTRDGTVALSGRHVRVAQNRGTGASLVRLDACK